MPYNLRRPTNSAYMLPEESQVFDALRAFDFEPERTSVCDFCPTHVLSQAYLEYMDRGGFAEILTPTLFGVALRRVFDIDPERKTRRTYQGKNVPGYMHVRGPGAIVSHDRRGNPRLYARPKAPAAEAATEILLQPAGLGVATEAFESRLAAARAAAANGDGE